MKAMKQTFIAAVAVAAACITSGAFAGNRSDLRDDRTPREIAEAIFLSPLDRGMVQYASVLGRFAAIHAQSDLSAGRYGVMAMSKADLAKAGIDPTEYSAADIQAQVNIWARMATERFDRKRLSPDQRRGLSATGGVYCVFDLDTACLTRKGPPLARWASLKESGYFRAEIAAAIRSTDLHPVLKSHADEIARLVLGRREKSNCCAGTLPIHRSDLAQRGLTPNEFELMSLQEQISIWATIANSRFVTDQIGPIYATPTMLIQLDPQASH